MGIFFALGAALANSFQNSFFQGLKSIDTSVVNWFRFVVALPLLALLITIFGQWDMPPPIFWVIVLGVCLPLELTLSYFYVRALQDAPQSIAGPLFSLSALFLVPIGYLVLGEIPSLLGGVGIASIIAGPFFLGKEGQAMGRGVWRLFQERGTRSMLIAALVASLVISVSKFAFRYTTPLFFAFSITAALLVALGLFSFLRRSRLESGALPSLMGLSSSYGVSLVFHYVGLSMLLAAYFVSIKRLSIIFDVFFGRLLHHEDRFRERLTGALLMAAGVILIALG